MSENWLADNQGYIKFTDKLLPGFWLTLLLLFGINTILAVSYHHQWLGLNFITIVENIPEINNAPMGLRQFPAHTNIWWVWGIAFLLIVICLPLRRSFFGRALIAIGQDQDKAEHARVDNLTVSRRYDPHSSL